jgi:hypothetical protein
MALSPESQLAAALDPEQQRVGNMRRRAFMLRRHALAQDPLTGKSALAVAAGRKGGQRTAEQHPSPSAWGLSMALLRHHGVPLPVAWSVGED